MLGPATLPVSTVSTAGVVAVAVVVATEDWTVVSPAGREVGEVVVVVVVVTTWGRLATEPIAAI